MNIRRYETAAAFKQALEQRLRSAAPAGTDFARRRQLLVFDRFLARVAFEFGETVTLKGGWRSSCASSAPGRPKTSTCG